MSAALAIINSYRLGEDEARAREDAVGAREGDELKYPRYEQCAH